MTSVKTGTIITLTAMVCFLFCRNAWCTRESGVFLLFFMDILTRELGTAHNSIKDELETAFEQCVFCLYGHPNKKAKARHLFDHNAPSVRYCWGCLNFVLYICRPPLLLQCSQYKMLLELFVFYVVCLQTALIGDQCILCCMFADHPDGSQCILCCVLADHLDQRPVYFVLCICRPP